MLARAGHAVTVYEGAPTDRRRRAIRRTDAARFCPRCLLGGASPGRLLRPASNSSRWRRTAWSGSTPTLRWPTRWMTARAVLLERSICRDRRQSGTGWRSLASALRAVCCGLAPPSPRCAGPAPACRAIRSLLARFGMHAMRSARSLAESRFRGHARARPVRRHRRAFHAAARSAAQRRHRSRAWGVRAHGGLALSARRRADAFRDALAAYLRSLGGEILTARAGDLSARCARRDVRCDAAPVARARRRPLPGLPFAHALERYRYGPGAFKVDWALDAPIPWRAPECARAGTVHLGGTLEEIAAWEIAPHGQSLRPARAAHSFDPTRAPAGKHTAWAYCHVPNGSTLDMTDAIEDPGGTLRPGLPAAHSGRASSAAPPPWKSHNPNLVGGDFNGGAIDLRQFFLRPTRRLYRTPLPGVFFCGASTPPGGGVHGMCGFHAAQIAASKFRASVR